MTTDRKERRDVARHRTAILNAAARVFSEHGAHAPMNMIAEHAGVGRATLHRHYPDRQSLLLAIFDRTISPILEDVDALPPADALLGLLSRLERAARHTPPMTEAWRYLAKRDPAIKLRQDRMKDRLEVMLSEARSAGKVRQDLTVEDLIRVIRMVIAANHPGDIIGDSRGRVVELVFNGLRPSD